VSHYVPAFAAEGKRDVLIRHLLTHTSGLPDMLPDNEKLRGAHQPLSSFLQGTSRLPLMFPPGTRVNYQSMGIAMLVEIVHQITGVTLSDFLAKEVFGPLEMPDTSLGVTGERRARIAGIRVPAELEKADWNWNSPYWHGFGAPWGGLVTTPSNFARFCQMMCGGGALGKARILSPESVRAITSNQLAAMPAIPEDERRCRPWDLGWRLNWPAHSANFGDLARAPSATGARPERYAVSTPTRTHSSSSSDAAAGARWTLLGPVVEHRDGRIGLSVIVLKPPAHSAAVVMAADGSVLRLHKMDPYSLKRIRFRRGLSTNRGSTRFHKTRSEVLGRVHRRTLLAGIRQMRVRFAQRYLVR